MRRFALVGVVGLAVVGCPGPEPEEPPHGDGHAGGHGHGHHHHTHSSPAELRPLMRDLYAWSTAIQAGIGTEDRQAVAAAAAQISAACDDEDVGALDPERFGPRFAELDRALHRAAGELAAEAADDDVGWTALRQLYTAMVDACADCHEQAPSARSVELGGLALR